MEGNGAAFRFHARTTTCMPSTRVCTPETKPTGPTPPPASTSSLAGDDLFACGRIRGFRIGGGLIGLGLLLALRFFFLLFRKVLLALRKSIVGFSQVTASVSD
jgi:hypothetical protein